MNDYNEYIFYVPFLHLEVRDWVHKKERLKNVLNLCDLNNKIETEINTDYHNKNNNYQEVISDILREEIDIFNNHYNLKLTIMDAWFERADKKNYHKVHNHGCIGYSSVCYIDYDEEEHTATQFIAPFNNFLNGDCLNYTPNVKEGSLIFFPSSIVHYTLPNESEKERTILSFNLRVG